MSNSDPSSVETEGAASEQHEPADPADTNASSHDESASSALLTDGDADKVTAQTPEAAAPSPDTEEPSEGRRTFSKIHVSHILDEVLEESAETAALPEAERKKLRYPILMDVVLGLGLLVAMGGFTVGLFHMYIVHAAADSINKTNYEAAIALLRGAPLPQVFAMPGSDTEELLSQALYLDSLEKTKIGRRDLAMEQLRLIKPGSKFFAGAQHLISDNTEPAEVLLEGATVTVETSPPEVKKTAVERALQTDD